MAQAKMAASLQDDGLAASLLVAAPAGSQAAVSATGDAGAGALAVAANRDVVGGFAYDHGAVREQVMVKDLSDGVAGHGADEFVARDRDMAAPFFTRTADAPKSGVGSFARGHGVVGEVLADKDLADGVVRHGADEFVARDTAAPFFTLIADAPKSGAGGFARGHGVVGEELAHMIPAGEVGRGADDTAAPFAGLSRAGAVGERLVVVDMSLARVLGERGEGDTAAPFAVVYKDDIAAPLLAVVDKDNANILARDTAAPFAGAAPSSHNAGQISIDVGVLDGKAGVPTAAKGAAAGGKLDSAVVGILAASTAVTMFATAGAVSPPVGFGLFVLLLGGLSLIVNAVRGA